jgi:hypothetical protein
MLNFNSDDWKFVKEQLESHLANQRDLIENPAKTYREVLEARGKIQILKTLLNLPISIQQISANQGQ